MSTLCIWFPDWPVQYHFVRNGQLPDRPVIIQGAATGRGPDRQVVDCCGQARDLGLQPGMPLAEAEAIWDRTAHKLPAPLFYIHDPASERKQLQLLAQACQQFSPHVSLEESSKATRPGGCHTSPQALLLDTSQLTHLFGGDQAILQAVGRELSRQGYQARLALAPTPGAAWAISHHGQLSRSLPACLPDRYIRLGLTAGCWWVPRPQLLAELDPLPVSALRITDQQVELLSQLGISLISQLRQIPRQQLVPRLGAELARQLDYALGHQPEPLVPCPQSACHHHQLSLEHPTTDRAVLERGLQHLLDRLLPSLAAHNQGLIQLACRLQSAVSCQDIPLTLYLPTTDTGHVLSLLQLQLQQFQLSQPIEQIEIEATMTAELERHQEALFPRLLDNPGGHGHSFPAAMVRLLDRLGSRLGAGCILHPRLLPESQPERSWEHHPAGQSRRRRQTTLSADTIRPLQLLPAPQQLAPRGWLSAGLPRSFCHGQRRYQVQHYWGPERIETGWWRQATVRRDYYRVELLSGHRFWIYQDLAQNTWFLHGEFS